MNSSERYERFPEGFFARMDDTSDRDFYSQPRLVTHIDDGAIAAVGGFYRDLGIEGRVLDLMSSWISHFADRPDALVAAGRNRAELAANDAAAGAVVIDLNRHQGLPFADRSFDAATCCVSVDYLTSPLEVFDEVARVLRPGATFCVTFSNRCFPTKVIQGWAQTDDRTHVAIVADYFRASGPWEEPNYATDGPPDRPGDPLYAVWARRGH
ncbi:MAG: class I SAM-dependent methyltransferase [Acidimicrobiales bacterium]